MNCNELQEAPKGERYIVKRPKALQWFYKGQLQKVKDEERQAGRFELFLDLLCEFSPVVSIYMKEALSRSRHLQTQENSSLA